MAEGALRRSKFFSVDLAETLYKMTAYGTRAEKLHASSYVKKAQYNVALDSNRLFNLCMDGLNAEFAVEQVNAVPSVIRGVVPHDAHTIKYSSCLLLDEVHDGAMWLVGLLGIIASYQDISADKKKKAEEMLMTFVYSKSNSCAAYSVEALLDFSDIATIRKIMLEKAKPILDSIEKEGEMNADPSLLANVEFEEGPASGLAWHAILWLVHDHNEAAATAIDIAFEHAMHAERDIFHTNLGLLLGIGFWRARGVKMPQTIFQKLRLLIQKAIIRDEKGELPWANSEMLGMWYAMRAATSTIYAIRRQLKGLAKDRELASWSATIGSFLSTVGRRDHPVWIPVLQKTISALTACEQPRSRLELVPHLLHDDPSVVRHAAKGLLGVVGLNACIEEIVTAAAQSDADETIELLANAMRLVVQRGGPSVKENVIEQLEEEMNVGTVERQNASRQLLMEMGGANAMRKLQARSDNVNSYRQIMREAEEQMQQQFKQTMLDAQRGFNIALAMDVTVFLVGVVLILLSGIMAISNDNLDNWAGIGASGGTGALATLYSLLVAKPRAQVKKSVDHLMYIKVVFLGYLRELQQTDQSFSRRMLDDKGVTDSELMTFKDTVQSIMDDALLHLQSTWSRKTKNDDLSMVGPIIKPTKSAYKGNKIVPISESDMQSASFDVEAIENAHKQTTLAS